MLGRPAPFRRRTIVLYLVAIALPTLALLGLGIHAVLRQRDALANLRTANLLLSAERVVAELERAAWSDAERILHDPALFAQQAPSPIVSSDRIPTITTQLRDRHPVLDQLWITEAGRVLYPPSPAHGTQAAIAGLLQTNFRVIMPLHPGEIYPLALNQPPFAQFFYTPLISPDGHDRVLLVSLNLEKVNSITLPGAAKRAQAPGTASIVPIAAPHQPFSATFKTIYPFWTLALPTPLPSAAERLDTLVFSSTVAAVLALLLLGVFLLYRDNLRQWRMNELRANFVAGVSHDLRTPVSVIRLYAETLLEKQNFPEEERQSFYQTLVNESEHLTRLVERVLDFSRIHRGARRYDLRLGDLNSSIAELIARHVPLWEQQGFSVHHSSSAELPPAVFDSDAVAQATLNLVENAIRYSNGSRRIETRLFLSGDWLVFAVRDFGIGVPATERERIFDAFYRIPLPDRKPGYGLGLFLVRHIMSAHGGSVELTPVKGPGSEFSLRFPVCKRS